MSTRKKRILLSNEASFSASGYGTYGMAIMNHLYDTGKYELAEHASYGLVHDDRDSSIRWRYYANAVGSEDPRYEEYKSQVTNQFGSWRLERVLLDFKPDIVFSIRDPWMMTHEGLTPLRRFYHYVIMPTVDSAPQKNDWIEYFTQADGVFTYSDWGQDVLRNQGGGLINLCGVASPCVEADVFSPVASKAEHRSKMGFDEDSIIIGTVMRNQRRKFYADLMIAFKNYLNAVPKELADKSYLYLHTSYPETHGWDLPSLMLEHGISNRVIVTYVCSMRGCHKTFSSFFQDAKTLCPHCHRLSAGLPNVINGVTRHELADVMNLFDVYVQYANCEGWGMPQVEAAACGIPVMAVDYSAMSEIVTKTHGYHIKLQKLTRELDTGADRAIPDNDHLTELLVKFFSQPKEMRRRRELQARNGVEKNYTWNITGRKWEDYFDSVVPTGQQGKWDAPPIIISPMTKMPNVKMGNDDFVRWAISNVLQDEKMLDSYSELALIKQLNYDAKGKGVENLRQGIIKRFLSMVKNNNHVEACRANPKKMIPEDYIEYAHMKERVNG